ncbi:MAG: SDR family oxidoreductase [Clostridiales bacterium]|nr:SDR family oxidoreductase [Clostridiales bacterium]
MRILITGSSSGIGKKVAEMFLGKGHQVFGIDLNASSIKDTNYTHIVADIKDKNALPEIENIDIIFNNAGLQNSNDDIANNLQGTINVTEKYMEGNSALKSILFNASASSISGAEFPQYAASKAGVVGYMKNVAIKLAPKGITVNAISLGGVKTDLNKPVMEDKEKFAKIMEVTPMKKWTEVEEVCEWVYFLTCVNKSCSGQNILIDNGEHDLNDRFVW